jgi:hypothetical protein
MALEVPGERRATRTTFATPTTPAHHQASAAAAAAVVAAPQPAADAADAAAITTSTLSGSLLLSHSIEPKTLPTWTKAKYVSNDDPSSLGLTIAAGLKIELAEIAAFSVPTEHPESSLQDNNSQYLLPYPC